eukprot:scaffold47950_cov33-Tisochrysis_lutea.AAC.1
MTEQPLKRACLVSSSPMPRVAPTMSTVHPASSGVTTGWSSRSAEPGAAEKAFNAAVTEARLLKCLGEDAPGGWMAKMTIGTIDASM